MTDDDNGNPPDSDGPLTDPDADADRRFSNMLFDLVGQIQAAQAKGLSPRDIFDPASDDYIGDRLISAHAATPSERLGAWADTIRGQNPQMRQPLETVQDYLNRPANSGVPPQSNEPPASMTGALQGAAGNDDVNQPTRDRISWIAKNLVGKTEWSDDTENGLYGSGTNKCNLFVYNVLSAAGASPGTPNGYVHKYPPNADQWGDPNYEIPGWEVLNLNETPQPGDVIAQKLDYSDATGHVMIVGPNGTVIGTGDSSGGPHGTVEQIPRPAKLGPNPLGPVIFRRYRGRPGS